VLLSERMVPHERVHRGAEEDWPGDIPGPNDAGLGCRILSRHKKKKREAYEKVVRKPVCEFGKGVCVQRSYDEDVGPPPQLEKTY